MHTRVLILLGSLLMITTARTAAAADCTWTITGRVQASDTTAFLDPGAVARTLAGIEIKVSGSLLDSGGFFDWGSVHTGTDGSFTLTQVKSCANRNFKVEARFENATLQIRRGIASDWMTIYQTGSKRAPGTLAIGTRTFVDGTSSSDLNDHDNYIRALSWYFARNIVDYLVGLDPWFAFDGQLHIEYPAEASTWAEGVTRTAHLKNWHPLTLAHETMHIWNYDHNTGTSDWLDAWAFDGTHSFQEAPSIAFHEGFASWASYEILEQLWGRAAPHLDAPELRQRMAANGLNTLAMVERNDHGVSDVLGLLTRHDPFAEVTDPQVSCPKTPVTLTDILRSFRAGAGYPTDWAVGNENVGLWAFLQRAEDLTAAVTGNLHAFVRDAADVTSTATASDFCPLKRWPRL